MSQLEDRMEYENIFSVTDPPPYPSLRDLKRLKILKLSFDDNGDVCNVIYKVGVYMAFLRMSNQIRLTLDGNFSISSELAAKLTDHFQDIYITPSKRLKPEVKATDDSSDSEFESDSTSDFELDSNSTLDSDVESRHNEVLAAQILTNKEQHRCRDYWPQLSEFQFPLNLVKLLYC